MFRLTKETDEGFTWSDSFNEVFELDPNEFENTKLEFIGMCENMFGITPDIFPYLIGSHPCKAKKCLIKKLFFR